MSPKNILNKVEQAKEKASALFTDTFNLTIRPEIINWLTVNNYSSLEFSMGTWSVEREGVALYSVAKTHEEFFQSLNDLISYNDLYAGDFIFHPYTPAEMKVAQEGAYEEIVAPDGIDIVSHTYWQMTGLINSRVKGCWNKTIHLLGNTFYGKIETLKSLDIPHRPWADDKTTATVDVKDLRDAVKKIYERDGRIFFNDYTNVR